MRTKLLPEAVDRTLRDKRDQTVGKVMRRLRKPARRTAGGDPPPTPES
jgi:hypothetical protein